MAHENGGVLVDVAVRDIVLELLVEEKPRRETDDAANLDWGRQTGEYAHGTTLGEAAEDNAVGRNAVLDLLLNEAMQIVAGLENARAVLICTLDESFLSLSAVRGRFLSC